MIQGSHEWHSWRQQGVCASDSPAILGVSPYTTAYELWQEKTSRKPQKSISAYAVAKGGATEAQIRARMAIELSCDLQAVCAQHDKFPWLRASLDAVGMDSAGNLLAVEIKFVGKPALDLASIPRHHYIQIQHQLLVLDIPGMWYCSSTSDTANYVRLLVPADAAVQADILSRATVFYSHMTLDTPPPMTDQDWWPATPELEALLVDYVPSNKEARAAIKALATKPRIRATKFQVTNHANKLRVVSLHSQPDEPAEQSQG